MKPSLVLFCLMLLVACVPQCYGDDGLVNGVLAQERIVNLPQDAGKWYVSVVGNPNDARYRQILGWFDSNDNLNKVKNQVHFCQVASNTAIYRERYAPNLKGIPAVRVQRPDGVVVYEAVGNKIPMSSQALHSAIAGDVQAAQGIEAVLPWRRMMENRCPCPRPTPPNVDPVTPDPNEQPLDDEEEEEVDEGVNVAVVVWVAVSLLLMCAIVGTATGALIEWKKSAAK